MCSSDLYLSTTRPDLLPGEEQKIRGWLVPVVSILLISGVLSLCASAWPDGLEKVAEKLGFIDLAANVRVIVPTPLADYNIQGLGKIGTSIAGLVGATACFGVAFGIAKIIRPKNA